MVRVGLFAVVAAAVYFALAILAVVVAGEVSCYRVCSPTTEFLSNAYPLPMIGALALALALGVAFLVDRPRPH